MRSPSDEDTADAAAGPTRPGAPLDASAASGEAEGTVIFVTVTRTGGIAGLRKQWSAEPPVEEGERWATLIESCPWDVTVTQAGSADRYVWAIDARCGDQRREARLPDQAIAGPWRLLVDEVRHASAP